MSRHEGVVDAAHLDVEVLDTLGEVTDHNVGRIRHRVVSFAGPHSSGLRDESGLVSILVSDPDLVGCTDDELPQLVQRRDPLTTCRTASNQQDPHLLDPAVHAVSVSPTPTRTAQPSPPKPRRPDQTSPTGDGPAGSADPPPPRRHPGRGGTGTDRPHTNRCPPPRPAAPDQTRPTNRPAPHSRQQSAGNDSIPNTPPLRSTAAATCTSAWVSTPPTTPDTIDMAAPFTRVWAKGWHTPPGRRNGPNRAACLSSTGEPPPNRGVQHQPHHPTQPDMGGLSMGRWLVGWDGFRRKCVFCLSCNRCL